MNKFLGTTLKQEFIGFIFKHFSVKKAGLKKYILFIIIIIYFCCHHFSIALLEHTPMHTLLKNLHNRYARHLKYYNTLQTRIIKIHK